MIKEPITCTKKGMARPATPLMRICDFLFMSAQLPVDLETGEPVRGDIRVQTEAVLKNIQRLLMEADLDFSYVLQVTVYMTDLSKLPEMDEVYCRYFSDPYPARTTLQVMALEGGADIQIECAALDSRAMEVLCAQEEEGCSGECCCR